MPVEISSFYPVVQLTASLIFVFAECSILIVKMLLSKFFRERKRWDIYYIYGVSSGYIQRYSRLNLGFFSSSAKKSLGQGRALGIFFCLGWKKPRSRGYIGIYGPPRPHIRRTRSTSRLFQLYIFFIYIYNSFYRKIQCVSAFLSQKSMRFILWNKIKGIEFWTN